MANDFFQFKQFTVWHDGCAMKVGTDGVLLGAWCPVQLAQHILDVGTGSGLLALMCAQRNQQAVIEAIDIDRDAVNQAEKNVRESPWHERIVVREGNFLTFPSTGNYDLLISNPPFFQDSLKCPDAGRTTARHTDTLPYQALAEHAYACLVDEGVLAVVLPIELQQLFMQLALRTGFSILHVTQVCTKEGKQPKRVLMAFRKGLVSAPVYDQLCIQNACSQYSEAYRALTADFYLAF